MEELSPQHRRLVQSVFEQTAREQQEQFLKEATSNIAYTDPRIERIKHKHPHELDTDRSIYEDEPFCE